MTALIMEANIRLPLVAAVPSWSFTYSPERLQGGEKKNLLLHLLYTDKSNQRGRLLTACLHQHQHRRRHITLMLAYKSALIDREVQTEIEWLSHYLFVCC